MYVLIENKPAGLMLREIAEVEMFISFIFLSALSISPSVSPVLYTG